MRTNHQPVAALVRGPLDGQHQYCTLIRGFLPDAFAPADYPEGEYVLARTVTHEDGSLCGGIYRWEVRR